LGYYRASSNEIARHAGVSWGVIQYHFGTRQRLLLDVLHSEVEEALHQLIGVQISGGTQRQRLSSLFDVVLGFYGRREYWAIMQILWNLGRDPETEVSALAELNGYTDRMRDYWKRLFDRTIASSVSPDLAEMTFLLMWGAAVEEAAAKLMLDSVRVSARLSPDLRKNLLLDSIEGMIERNG
jgi:AcrR family transcriptional regulator